MGFRLGRQGARIALVAGVILASVGGAMAGPWSSLPEAVTRLQRDPGDRTAAGAIEDAERSILSEAAGGRLQAVSALAQAYENLVSPLANGEVLCRDMRQKVGEILVVFGDSRFGSDPALAGRAWALAAAITMSDESIARLRRLMLPPASAESGDVWQSTEDGAELVFHPAMQFELGCTWGDGECADDEAGRWVDVDGFWIERTEVTNRRYRLCVEAGVCSPPADTRSFLDPASADQPVVGVSWYQARTYAAWTGRRLPSEAEWERAARGEHETSRFPWGKGKTPESANLYQTSGYDSFEELTEAGSFPATGLGVYDMAGSVWEWCADRYHRDNTAGPRDGSPRESGGWGRVLRGGSWRRTIELARVSSRTWYEEDYTADDVGFRCAADPPDEVQPMRLANLAAHVYPVYAMPGTELEGADLSATDRRYLDRMALTWKVLEGRIEDAVPRAVLLLRRDPRDPVALGFLDQLEKEMTADVRRGDIGVAETALARYRDAANGDRSLARRLAAHEERLLDQVQVTLRTFVGRGEFERASAGLQLVRTMRPGDPILVTLTATIQPRPGAVREWRGDRREMVWIPAGEYKMGASPGDASAAYDEHPAHSVQVDGFWIDRTEVTNDQYRTCVDAGACSPPQRTVAYDDPSHGNHPVLWVSWFQAKTYARWAHKRLPTEAEWERAARGGRPTRYPWGDYWHDGAANAAGALGDDRWGATAPVASFEPGAWGVYDLLGNAAEWVEDVYHKTYWNAPHDDHAWLQLDGPPVERRRVVRGGSHVTQPVRLRVSHREDRVPETINRAIGFRCAAD